MIDEILSGVPLPRLIKVRQQFPRPVVTDVAGAVRAALHREGILSGVRPGDRVAITAGSRGISNIVVILREIVDVLKRAGARPFIIPAMGSHGGATAAGQTAALHSLGIKEESVGAPIRASMDVVTLGTTPEGIPVRFDRLAAEAEGVIVVNRVKAHTSFRGSYESGLAKMIAIGLGKRQGAEVCHATGLGNMSRRIAEIARLSLEKGNILFGVALVENAYDDTCLVEAIPAHLIMGTEPDLLNLANDNVARILLPRFDVLIVDEIGKNISGNGMDTNVIGRFTSEEIPDRHIMQRIAVLDLTEESHGNAHGIGLADVCSEKIFRKISFAQTYPNPLTARVPMSAKIPMVMPNDRMALQAAVKTCWDLEPENVKLVRIKNTMQLEEIYISESLLEDAAGVPNLEVIGRPEQLQFDVDGNLRKLT